MDKGGDHTSDCEVRGRVEVGVKSVCESGEKCAAMNEWNTQWRILSQSVRIVLLLGSRFVLWKQKRLGNELYKNNGWRKEPIALTNLAAHRRDTGDGKERGISRFRGL